MKLIVLTLVLIIGFCYAKIDLSNPPNIDDLPLIKERCEKKGKLESYEKLKEKLQETRTCIEGLIDVSKVKDEIEESKKTGSMDEVFGKYCGKRPQLKECIKKTTDVAKDCMDDKEKDALNTTANLIEEIGNFACFHDGDRLAMFIAEGGVECIKSRQEGLKSCINKTINFDASSFTMNSFSSSLTTTIPTLTIDKAKCDDLGKLQECVVKDLEDNCKDSTPANIVEAVFKFVKKTACKNAKQKRSTNSHRIVKRTVNLVFSSTKVQLTELGRKMCDKYGGAPATEHLLREINQSRADCRQHRMFVTPKEDMKKEIKECSKGIVSAFEDCLPNDAKYFPGFFLDTLLSVVEFGYTYMETLKASKTNRDLMQCLQDIKKDDNSRHIAECYSKELGSDIFQMKDIPSKPDMCTKMATINNCIKGVIKRACVDDIDISRLIDGFIEVLQKPCTATTA